MPAAAVASLTPAITGMSGTLVGASGEIGVVMGRLVPGKIQPSWPDLFHGRPTRFVLEEAHGIDSTRFQLVTNHLDAKRINAVQHQNIVFHALLKQIPWGVVDRLVEEHGADGDPRRLKTKPQSHASKLYHLGGCTMSKSALATANRERPVEVFAGLLAALMARLQAGYRRKIGDCIRLIDSTSVQLNGLSGNWARFSTGVCGAKAHIVYDPDADQPLYLMVSAANVNDITAAKAMPIEAGATYVFDLGYHDFGWWVELADAGCRIVTRFKKNTTFTVTKELQLPEGSNILSDRVGYLAQRMKRNRMNPFQAAVREV